MRRGILTSILLIVLLAPSICAATFPKPAGFVNDFANVIQPAAAQRLEALLRALEKKTGVEVAVVTVSSLDERPIEDYAVDLYKEWGIGKKGVDEGALILVAPNEKRVRIEVGYGLEGTLNDAEAGRIIRDGMVPFFKKSDFTRGIIAGAQSVVGVALHEKGFKPTDLADAGYQPQSYEERKGGPIPVIFKILLAVIFIIIFIRHPWLALFFLAGGRGGRVGGGGGFSGGFGGFGGGMSGGGGASGSW
jgi:uncharacterized protein